MLSRLEADRCGSSAPGKGGLENPKTYLKNPSGRKEGFTPSRKGRQEYIILYYALRLSGFA